jgi:hypothetical protein
MRCDVKVEHIRSELQRLLRQAPFRLFAITFVGGEQAIIEHSENVAFDPRPGGASEFYVLTGSLRMFSTFDAISSIAILSGSGTVPGGSPNA